jgi:hypothetical protein
VASLMCPGGSQRMKLQAGAEAAIVKTLSRWAGLRWLVPPFWQRS